MGARAWITAGWVFIIGMAGLVIAAIVLVVTAGSADHVCVQLAGVSCPPGGRNLFTGLGGAPLIGGAQLLAGLICAVGAGVAFFSGLACFFWAAHLRTLHALAATIGKSPASDAR